MNKVILIGNAGNDAEWKSKKGPVTFSLATNENYKKEDGEWETITEWHYIVVWGTEKYKEYISEKILKGDLLAVEGKIETNTYEDNEGNEKKVVRIKASNVKVILSKSDGNKQSKRSVEGNSSSEKRSSSKNDEYEDDLPF